MAHRLKRRLHDNRSPSPSPDIAYLLPEYTNLFPTSDSSLKSSLVASSNVQSLIPNNPQELLNSSSNFTMNDAHRLQSSIHRPSSLSPPSIGNFISDMDRLKSGRPDRWSISPSQIRNIDVTSKSMETNYFNSSPHKFDVNDSFNKSVMQYNDEEVEFSERSMRKTYTLLKQGTIIIDIPQQDTAAMTADGEYDDGKDKNYISSYIDSVFSSDIKVCYYITFLYYSSFIYSI